MISINQPQQTQVSFNGLRRNILLLSVLVLMCSGFSAWSQDVKTVLAKHIEAHGGRAAYDALKSVKLTGNFTAYSITQPFTLIRTQAGQLYFDHHWTGKKIILGVNAQNKAWWYNQMLFRAPNFAPDWAQPQFRDYGMMVSTLFDAEKRGATLRYLGNQELDGVALLGLELTHKSGEKETWLLDPTTYLATALQCQANDFGEKMPQTTWFDDYRPINGVQIAHAVEITYGTRHWLLEITEAKANEPVPASQFEMPWSQAMKPLQNMVGAWQVKGSLSEGPGAKFTDFETVSDIQIPYGKTVIVEQIHIPGLNPYHMVRQISFDPYRNHYLVQEHTDDNGLVRLHTGNWANKELSADTLTSGTTYIDWNNTTYHGRVRLKVTDANHFTIEKDLSEDGKEWWTALKLLYTRK